MYRTSIELRFIWPKYLIEILHLFIIAFMSGTDQLVSPAEFFTNCDQYRAI